jgi:hypothetical protein
MFHDPINYNTEHTLEIFLKNIFVENFLAPIANHSLVETARGNNNDNLARLSDIGVRFIIAVKLLF